MSIDSILTDFSIWNLLIRFLMNFVVLFILIGVVYYRFSKKAEYVFFYFLIGTMIFLICSILKTIDISMGVALGLFALFAIIRFRTVQYSVKDITYVFIVIGISVINSQANIPPPIISALVINITVLCMTCMLELFLQKRTMNSVIITYNKPELLKPGYNADMIKDLSHHTGQNIERVVVRKLDIGKSSAEIEVFYNDKESIIQNIPNSELN